MKLEIQRYLPIGSVVLLKNTTKKLMITGFCMQVEKDGEKIYYDYIGCFWPEGIIETDKNFLFYHSDIEEIIATGYSTDEFAKFKEKLSTFVEEQKIQNDDTNDTNVANETKTVTKQPISIEPVANNNSDEVL